MSENKRKMLPREIEEESFAIITRELGGIRLDPENEPVIKRVIHTSADFDYARNLRFSSGAVRAGKKALLSGATVITDTQMALAGINKKKLGEYGGEGLCYISDPDVALRAQEAGSTRAAASMEKAAKLTGPLIFAVGNAPTALLRLSELILEKELSPALVVGVPVGFVNVVESKEIIMRSGAPYIVAVGKKGGSNVAAAIINALLYEL
jgi:precorrin-8X/cobalt-precorrin-8 methylmutase